MKKITCLLILVLLLVSGCRNSRFDKSSFIDKASYNGYLLKEDNTGYEIYEKIKIVYYAINRENAYDIQFLELEDDEYAKKFFLLNANTIKEKITKDDYLKSKSLSDYELYHAENDSEYMMVLRSKNNIIYIDAPIEYINEIEEFLEDLQIDY